MNDYLREVFHFSEEVHWEDRVDIEQSRKEYFPYEVLELSKRRKKRISKRKFVELLDWFSMRRWCIVSLVVGTDCLKDPMFVMSRLTKIRPN